MISTRRTSFLLPDAIAHHARFSPNDLAFVCDDYRLTWRQFERRTNQAAHALRDAGVRKGDNVCIYMPNGPRAFEVFWGIIRAGGVVVSLNVQFEPETLVRMANDSRARLLVTNAELAPQVTAIRDRFEYIRDEGLFALGSGHGLRAIEPLVDAAPETLVDIVIDASDSISIVYSSGTTGQPKGIEHSHFARHNFCLGLGPQMGIRDRHAVSLITTPIYTNGAWITMAPTIFHGGTVVLAPKFSPEIFLELVERHRCTHAFVVPTQIIMILACPDLDRRDLGSLKGVMSAGQALLPATYDALTERWPHVAIFEAYGMSEGFGTIAGPEDFARGKKGSVGKSHFLDDIAVLDDQGNELPPGQIGEIAGWSIGMMKGYFRDPERTEAALWHGPDGRTLLRSGDLGYLDEDGYLYVSGRVKDMIKSGGINVFSTDIEAAFMAHPDVSELAAIGIPHDKWGETPLLLAILRPGATVTEDELKEWGNARLAKYQRVSRVEFRTEFARVQYGKINKTEMRAPYWAGRARTI